MKFGISFLSILSLLFSGLLYSQEGKKTFLVQDSKSKYQVEVDHDAKKIKVISLNKDLRHAKDMSITLYNNFNTEQTVNLEAVDLSSQRPEYLGNLGPGQGSFVGFQLKFTLPKDGLKVLKYMPKIPVRH